MIFKSQSIHGWAIQGFKARECAIGRQADVSSRFAENEQTGWKIMRATTANLFTEGVERFIFFRWYHGHLESLYGIRIKIYFCRESLEPACNFSKISGDTHRFAPLAAAPMWHISMNSYGTSPFRVFLSLPWIHMEHTTTAECISLIS
jgi:hypothetical protein